MNRKDLGYAWEQMRHERNCPPFKVLSSGSPEALRHLASCARCREMVKEQEEDGMLEQIVSAAISRLSLPRPTPVHAGDVRTVRLQESPELWFDDTGEYFNPPAVLVLTEADSSAEVEVAQLFDSGLLCSSGDIALDEESGWGFAEAWNIYRLPVSVLSPRAYDHVDESRVRAVLAARTADALPSDENSPLYWFRVNELDTGSFFVGRAKLQQRNEEEDAERGILRGVKTVVWNKMEDAAAYVFSLPEPELLAASSAEDTPFNGEASRRIVFMMHSNSREPEILHAEVSREADNGFTLFNIQCPFAASLPEPEIAVQCAQAERSGDVSSERKGDKLYITAVFKGEDCRSADLKIALLLPAEN